MLRTLRLNCFIDAYADLWHDVYDRRSGPDCVGWRSEHARSSRLWVRSTGWTATTPLRIAEDRRQALVEIDALVALMLGVTADQLCTVYRTQFAVLYGYDHNRVPLRRQRPAGAQLGPDPSGGRRVTGSATRSGPPPTRRATPTPTSCRSCTLDREADMRAAYAEFERRLAGALVAELLPTVAGRDDLRQGLLDYLTTTFALADADARRR